jgi:hypothetical protein
MKPGNQKSTKSIIKDMSANSPEAKSKDSKPDSARKSMKGFLRNDSSNDDKDTNSSPHASSESGQNPKDMMRAFVGSNLPEKGSLQAPGGSPGKKKGKKNVDKDAWKRVQPVKPSSPSKMDKQSVASPAKSKAVATITASDGSSPSSLDAALDVATRLLQLLILLSAAFYIFLLTMQPHDKSLFGSLVLERFAAFVHNTFSISRGAVAV